MRRKHSAQASGKTLLFIDDNEEYLASCLRVGARDGHEVLSASSAAEGLEILRTRHVDLVLVDYFMPAMTGEEFVAELRKWNAYVQVILQTGYASERPPREMLRRLDIQGYHDKSEGPDKLALWIDVGLRAAFTVNLLNSSRQGLAYILNVTPELHRIQPIEKLLQGVLTQTVGLLGAVDSFLAVAPPPQKGAADQSAFVAIGSELRIRASTGRFVASEFVAGSLGDAELAMLNETLRTQRICVSDSSTFVPLRVGDTTLGLVYVDRAVLSERDTELLAVFANQAAVAIQNSTLYELAAVDPLTRVFARRFFDSSLVRELRVAQRSGRPVGVLMVDVDDMKSLNDRGGHLCGDRALEGIGALLREATRATDVVGRYGGDEFVIVLPQTDAAGVQVVVDRILRAASTLSVPGKAGPMPVRVTVGGAVLAPSRSVTSRSSRYFEGAARLVVASADEQLYRGKKEGKMRAGATANLAWPVDEESSSVRPGVEELRSAS